MNMGTDIHGFAEVFYPAKNEWFAVIDLDESLTRNYDMFGRLFGVQNNKSYHPIAANRGLPANASYLAKQEAEADEAIGCCHSKSWVSYHELDSSQFEWWQEFWLRLTELAEKHGRINVRLVVWFDN